MIRRSVRQRFHSVLLYREIPAIYTPAVLYANHHGWHDGYLAFHLLQRLKIEAVDWIQEFDAFPLFRFVGGMPFPLDDAARRITTIRRTLRLMRETKRSLLIFAEGTLHRAPEILPLGRALQVVGERVPNAVFVPLAIVYEMSLHERPQAYLSLGEPSKFTDLEDLRRSLERELETLKVQIREGANFEVLVRGTADVNERWDMRRLKR
jgi:1-acyl-sn-glycerol-3-phosphate acyltransferase